MIIATLYHTIDIACEPLSKEIIKKRSDLENPMQGRSIFESDKGFSVRKKRV
jgi:hypothetical protein